MAKVGTIRSTFRIMAAQPFDGIRFSSSSTIRRAKRAKLAFLTFPWWYNERGRVMLTKKYLKLLERETGEHEFLRDFPSPQSPPFRGDETGKKGMKVFKVLSSGCEILWRKKSSSLQIKLAMMLR